MATDKRQAYSDLIETLLSRPNEEESENFQTSQRLLDFWLQLLRTNENSVNDATAIHKLMRQNLTLVTPKLGQTIFKWVQAEVIKTPDRAEVISDLVQETCINIQKFPDDRHTEVLEIIFEGYKAAFIITQGKPDKQAKIIANLGNTLVNQAQLGIHPIINLDAAITLYDEAIRIQRDLDLKKELSSTLNNLGNVLLIKAKLGIDSIINLNNAIVVYNEAICIMSNLNLETNLYRAFNNLGNVFLTKAQLDINPNENVEDAIKVFRKAEKITRNLNLNRDLSSTLNNLANALVVQAKLDVNPSRKLEYAITLFTEATKITRDLYLKRELASTLNNLGGVLIAQAEFNINPIENLEQAIAAYTEAADILNDLNLTHDLSQVFNNLALALSNLGRILSTQAQLEDNPNIKLKQATDALIKATNIMRDLGLEEDLLNVLNDLGNIFIKQSELSIDSRANFDNAITAFTEATSLARTLELPDKLAIALNSLGLALNAQAALNIDIDPITKLEQATTAFSEAINVMRTLGLTRNLANALHNLGITLSVQAELGINPPAKLDAAITALTEATDIMRAVSLTHNLARSLNVLGEALRFQAELGIDPITNLEKATSALTEASRIMRTLGLKRDLATTLNFLGLVLRTQAELGINPTNNLEQAIINLTEAADITRTLGLTRELLSSLNHLGITLNTQAQLGVISNDESKDAVTIFFEATQIAHTLDLTYDLSVTLNGLGNALIIQAGLGIDPQNKLQQATTALTEAINITRTLGLTNNLSRLLTTLGLASLSQAVLGVDLANNLEQATSVLTEAVNLTRSLGLPRALSSALINLGSAFVMQAELSGNPDNKLEAAVACYREALTYFNPQILPVETLKAARALGNLHYRQGNWQLALDEGYLLAIAAVEQTHTWALSEARRQEIQAQASELYLNTVQAYVELRQYDQALALSERARSRRLVELFATKDLYRDGNIPPQIQTYLDQYFALEDQINALQQDLDRPDSDRSEPVLAGARRPLNRAGIAARSDTIAQLETQKQALWQEIYTYDPETAAQLQVSPLDFAAMRALLQGHPRTAILSCFSTATATHLFLLYPPNCPSPVANTQGIACHTCPGQDYQTLRTWLAENWLLPYLDDRPTWQTRMPQVLAELSDRLQINTLIDTYLQDIDELIIIPHLFLHQIPFAALPIGLGERSEEREARGEESLPSHALGERSGVRVLGDRFRLRYVPNTQILHFCQQRPPIPAIEQRAIVEDATDDLPCARFEGEYIAQLFGNQVQCRLQGKTEATTANYRQLLHDPSIQAIVSAHHAESRLDNPLESLLLLGDGAITLGYLFSPACRIPHLDEIILSCCETGLGADLESAADDVVTLAAGFLCAGARSVLSSLWSVDDLATALFAMRYHRHRQAGCDRPTALQQAQQDLRTLPGTTLSTDMNTLALYLIDAQDTAKANGDTAKAKQLHPLILRLRQLTTEPTPPFAAPHHWAAFVCHGLA